jgi:hypothetical protein
MATPDELRHVRPGDRPSASQHNAMVDLLHREVYGHNVVRMPGGSWLVKRQASRAVAFQIVFVTGIDETSVFVKIGTKTPTGWSVPTTGDSIAVVPMGTLTPAYFSKISIGLEQPQTKHTPCRLWSDGTLEPLWKFLLVDPPAAADCDVG